MGKDGLLTALLRDHPDMLNRLSAKQSLSGRHYRSPRASGWATIMWTGLSH